jgi:Putative zinc-finger
MQCEEVQDHLANYLADNLAESVRAEFLEHLVSCASCRTESESLKSIWAVQIDIPGEVPDLHASRRRFDAMLDAYTYGAEEVSRLTPTIRPRRRVFAVLAAVAVLGVGLYAAQQSGLVLIPLPPSPPIPAQIVPVPSQIDNYLGVVKGSIVQAGTFVPIGNVRIGLQRPGLAFQLFATTDASGRFIIPDVPAGTYSVFINSPGNTLAPNGGGPNTLTVGPNQPHGDVAFALVPSVAISGRIVDADNQPLPRVRVAVLRMGYVDGRPGLVNVRTGGFAISDDHGDYRIFWIPAGEYYVVAIPTDRSSVPIESDTAYVATYYPGTTDWTAARRVSVTDGGQPTFVNFQIQSVPTFNVRGRVVDSPQTAVVRPIASFYLVPHGPGSSPVGPRLLSNSLRAPVDGQFELGMVSPGSYFLYPLVVGGAFNGGGRYVGRVAIDVRNGDLDGVEITAHPGVDLSGRLIIQDDNGSIPWDSVRVRLKPEETLPSGLVALTNTVDSGGVFVAKNIPEGHYDFDIRLPQNAFVVDIAEADKSVFDAGITLDRAPNRSIQIVINPLGESIGGLVRNGGKNPAVGATVVLVPKPSRRKNVLLYRIANTDQSGRFTLHGIAPGEYKLFAWESIVDDAYLNAEFLARYEKTGREVVVQPSVRPEFQQLNLISSQH